jgi:hypothetical protein
MGKNFSHSIATKARPVLRDFNPSLKKGGCRAIEQLLAKSVSACLFLLNKKIETS